LGAVITLNISHDKCGTTLYIPTITFKEKGETKHEHLDNNWWCRKCKKFVIVEMSQTE